MTTQPPRATPQARFWIKILASLALVFGIMTVISGGRVLFGPVTAQLGAGNFVGFVVWFNFLAGGAYIIAAIGLLMRANWAVWLSAVIAIATALVAVWFVIVVALGTPFEMRTVAALALRVSLWVTIAIIARRAAPLT